MLYYNFKNYEEFKELFGIEVHGNGVKSRRNKILLQWLKQKWVLQGAVRGDEIAKLAIEARSLTYVWDLCMNQLHYRTCGAYCLRIGSFAILISNKYRLDEYCGVCVDGDPRAIRYVNTENDRVFKMKAGKFLKAIAQESDFGRSLSEPVMLWLCEEFTRQWETYTAGKVTEYKLVVDDDFYEIYDGRGRCSSDFHSCMRGGDHSTFYRDAVKAKAASLRNAEDRIVARCVIFTEVQDDETGEIVRLAERQYSAGCDDLLKRLLVDALIKGGHIDGYKRVGADCGNARGFVSNDGKDWSDREFSIECNLEPGDVLSYQDSFKSYDLYAHRADNYGNGDYDLESTDHYFEDEDENYDSWHDCYTSNELQRVYYHGREYWCDEDELDDFRYVDAGTGQWEYHHEDDVTYCSYEDIYVLNDDVSYSEVLEEYFYDTDKMAEAEEEYKADNWTWSEYDEEYYEDEDDVVTMHFADGSVQTISVESAEAFEFIIGDDGDYYELVEEEVTNEAA